MSVMEVLTAVLTITAPIIVTVVLTNYQTQKIIQTTIETSNRQTQRIIENSNRQTQKILRDINCLLEKMHRCLVKLDFGFEANARMHGWSREDDVSPERARKLPKPRIYNEMLRICYYKSN